MGRAAKVGGLVLGVALGAGAALAGLNPLRPGLPTASAYGSSYPGWPGAPGNGASSMCLECHTWNPKPGAGTHFVYNRDAVAARDTRNQTWEKLTVWSSGALSKYGTPATGNPTASLTGVQGQLLCESCHNLIKNAAGGNNLVAFYREVLTPDADAAQRVNVVDTMALCEGCHGNLGSPAHHPMTGDQVALGMPSQHVLDTRNARTTPTAGSLVTYPDPLSATSKGLNCGSCHTAHGAQVQTGARILKRGWSAVTSLPSIAGKALDVVYYGAQTGTIDGSSTSDVRASVVPGIDRQWDVTQILGAQRRVVSNADPLCDSCHTYND